MSETPSQPGAVPWFDLTVGDAEGIRDFYASVVGWESDAVRMDSYDDFCMKPPNRDAVAGICHARGVNTDLPPQWLIYITVANLQKSIDRCLALGGEVLHRRSNLAVIQDPAGACAALWQKDEAD